MEEWMQSDRRFPDLKLSGELDARGRFTPYIRWTGGRGLLGSRDGLDDVQGTTFGPVATRTAELPLSARSRSLNRLSIPCYTCMGRLQLRVLVIASPDRLCRLVVRVPGYRSRGPGSIPVTTRFLEK
jgi:hypothetical protein